MDSVIDLLWLRIPPIRYVCPPVCEVIFSGSSGSVIVLADHPTLGKVTGVIADCPLLRWDVYPGALCYNVYKETAAPNVYEVISDCQVLTTLVIEEGCYRVSAITTEGETDLSNASCCSVVPPPVLPKVTGVDADCPTLTWDEYTDADSYNIYKDGSFFASTTNTEYEITTGCYKVSAIVDGVESELSDESCCETPMSEVSRSINGGAFSVISIEGLSSENPVLSLGTDSTLGSIKLNWDIFYIDISGGMASGDIWCYKVRGTVPTEGNYSNVACAVRNQIFLGTGAVAYPTWQIAFGDLVSDDSTSVTSLDFSGLKAVIGGILYLDATIALTSVDLSSLISVSGSIQFSLTSITTLALPSLVNSGSGLYCDNTSLVSVSLPLLILKNGSTYAFDSSALNAASVEGILARGVASGITSATIRLDGGTNAGLSSLSLQGQADYATLFGLGNTISINA